MVLFFRSWEGKAASIQSSTGRDAVTAPAAAFMPQKKKKQKDLEL